MRYEIRYSRLGDFWSVVDTEVGVEVRFFRTRTAAQRLANLLNGEVVA